MCPACSPKKCYREPAISMFSMSQVTSLPHIVHRMGAWVSRNDLLDLLGALAGFKIKLLGLCGTSLLLAPEMGMLKCRSCHIVPRVAQKSLGPNCIWGRPSHPEEARNWCIQDWEGQLCYSSWNRFLLEVSKFPCIICFILFSPMSRPILKWKDTSKICKYLWSKGMTKVRGSSSNQKDLLANYTLGTEIGILVPNLLYKHTAVVFG